MSSKRTVVRAAGISLVILVSVSSCSTQQVGVDGFAIAPAPTDTHPAAFALSLASDVDTLDEQMQLNAITAPLYTLKIDGSTAISLTGGRLVPFQIRAAGLYLDGGWIPAGSHVFELVDTDGRTALSTPPYDIQPGRTNHLVVFGHRAALEHRLLSYEYGVPTDTYRYTVLNLVRSGESAVVLVCSGAAAETCTTPISGPIAYGEYASGEVVARPGPLAYQLLPVAADASPTVPIELATDPLSGTFMPDPPQLSRTLIGAPALMISGEWSGALY